MSEADDFLASGAYEKHPAYFNADTTAGDKLVGEVCDAPRVVRTPPIGGGDPEPKLVLAVQRKDGEVFSVWLRPGTQLFSEVALKTKDAHGSPGVKQGATIAIKYVGEGQKQPGKSAPKLYEVAYKAPVQADADQADLFAGDDEEEPF